jgi:hypothetical protein
MTRTRIKGIGMKSVSSPDTEPDLYQMGRSPSPSDCLLNLSCRSSFQFTGENSGDPKEDFLHGRDFLLAISPTSQLVPPAKNSIRYKSQRGRIYNASRRRASAGQKSYQENTTCAPPVLAALLQHIPSCIEPIRAASCGGETTLNRTTTRDELCLIAPSNGEVTYFEGKPFCYLEHVDLESVHAMMIDFRGGEASLIGDSFGMGGESSSPMDAGSIVAV